MDISAVHCLLLAWKLGESTAVVATQVKVGCDAAVIEVKSKTAFSSSKKNITWNIGATTEEKAIEKLNKEKLSWEYVTWPGTGGTITVLIYLAFFLCGFHHELMNMPVIQRIKSFLVAHVFKNAANAIMALQLMVLAHCVEAMYVASLLVKTKISNSAIVTWCLFTIWLGYPVTKRAQLLNKAASGIKKS